MRARRQPGLPDALFVAPDEAEEILPRPGRQRGEEAAGLERADRHALSFARRDEAKGEGSPVLPFGDGQVESGAPVAGGEMRR